MLLQSTQDSDIVHSYLGPTQLKVCELFFRRKNSQKNVHTPVRFEPWHSISAIQYSTTSATTTTTTAPPVRVKMASKTQFQNLKIRRVAQIQFFFLRLVFFFLKRDFFLKVCQQQFEIKIKILSWRTRT